MMLHARRNSLAGSILSLAVFATTGCEGMRQSDFLARHFTKDDKNAAAHERWDNFRGNVRLKMAEQHIQSRRFDEAEKVLLEARDMLPDVPQVLRLLAELHFETGHLAKARTEIEAYLVKAPEDAAGFAIAGRIASRDGRVDHAIELFRTAIDRAPDEADHRLKLAECLMVRGDSKAALSVLRESSQFDTSFALRQLAMEICDARGDRDGAATHARAVARFADNDAYVQERAGMILAGAGAHKDAVEVLGPIVRRRIRESSERSSQPETDDIDSSLEAICAFARSCLEINRDTEALAALKFAIREDASDRVAWSLYCRATIRAGELQKALDIVSTFNQRNDSIPEMLVLQAYVHFLLGDVEEARRTADRALRIDPSFEPAFMLKAKASVDHAAPREPTSTRAPVWTVVASRLLKRRHDRQEADRRRHADREWRSVENRDMPRVSQVAVAGGETGP